MSKLTLCATLGVSLLFASSQGFAAMNDYLNEDGSLATITNGDDYIITDPAGGANFQAIDLMNGNDTFVFGANATMPAGNIAAVGVNFGQNGTAYINGDILATTAGSDGIFAGNNLDVIVGTTGSLISDDYTIHAAGTTLNVTSNGQIQSLTDDAMWLNNGTFGSATIYLGSNSIITAAQDILYVDDGNISIENHGIMTAGDFLVETYSGSTGGTEANVVFNNYGVVNSGDSTFYIEPSANDVDLNVTLRNYDILQTASGAGIEILVDDYNYGDIDVSFENYDTATFIDQPVFSFNANADNFDLTGGLLEFNSVNNGYVRATGYVDIDISEDINDDWVTDSITINIVNNGTATMLGHGISVTHEGDFAAPEDTLTINFENHGSWIQTGNVINIVDVDDAVINFLNTEDVLSTTTVINDSIVYAAHVNMDNYGTITSTNGDIVNAFSMDVNNYGQIVTPAGYGLYSSGAGYINYYGGPGSELMSYLNAIDASNNTDIIVIDNASVVAFGPNALSMRLLDGDDFVTIIGHSHVQGLMDGGNDYDRLEFQLFGLCEDDVDDLQNQANGGTFTYWGETYTFQNFEEIVVDRFEFADYAETYNQGQIAETFDCIDTDMPTDELLTFLDTLYDEVVFGNFPEALNQLSPQRYEVFSKIAFNNHDFAMRHLNNRSSLLRENASGMWDTSGLTMLDKTLSPEFAQMNTMLTAAKSMKTGDVRKSRAPQPDPMNDNRFGFFLSGNAIMAEGDGTPDIYDYEWDTYGIVGGFDYKLFPTLAIGLMGGYSHTDVDLDNYGSDAEVESYMFGIYANWWWQNFYLNGMFNYAFNEYEGHREVPFLDNSHHFDTDGDQFNLGLAGGYDFHLGNFTVGPTAGIRYVNFNMDGFTEGGHGIDRLTVYDDDADSLRTSLGLKANYAFRAGTVAITPELRAAWGHEFLDDSRGMTARFNSSQLNPFTIQTTDPERDWAEVGGSVRAKFNDTISAFIDYDAQVGQDDFFAHSVNGGLRLEF